MTGACAAQRELETGDGASVVACDELHAEAPHVRLPDAGSDRVFGQIVNGEFSGADGKAYGIEGLADLEDREATRHGRAIYIADADGGRVSNLEPVLLLDEKHFLAALSGRSFEGLVSRRETGDAGPYAFDASLPVRVEFAAELAVRAEDGERVLRATVANLSGGVSGADESCLPSLASYGDEAPFDEGVDVELHGFRVPAMHLFSDDVFVMEWFLDGASEGTVMGPTWYVTPFDVVNGTTLPGAAYTGLGHGTPGLTPTNELGTATSGGGEPCEAE
jgi:hypothetical protein